MTQISLIRLANVIHQRTRLKTEIISSVLRCPKRRNGEHRKRRSRASCAAEPARPRSAHDQHPGPENAGQGARREHHQRIANGLKFNVRPRKAVSTRVRPGRGHAFNTAGVTRSETTTPSTTGPFEAGENVRQPADGSTNTFPRPSFYGLPTTLNWSFLFRGPEPLYRLSNTPRRVQERTRRTRKRTINA